MGREGQDMLDVSEVSVMVGPRTLLASLDFSVAAGELLGIVSNDRSARTLLLRLLVGEITPHSGSVRLGAQELGRQSLAELARCCAHLPQRPLADPGASVLEVVRVGRAPHRTRESPRMGLDITEAALQFMGE